MLRQKLSVLGDEQGQSMVLLALILVVVLGFAGISLDAGQYYKRQQAAQTVADAAALAGATALPTNPAGAADLARTAILANEMDPADFTITTSYQSNPNQIAVSVKQGMPTVFVRVLGIDQVAVTARAAARSAPPHAFDFALFSGSETEPLLIDGSNRVDGGTHGNADVLITGNNHLGAVEAAGSTSVSGSSQTGQVSSHVPTVPLPDVDYSTLARGPATVYNGNQTFSGNLGSGTILVHGDVTLNGNLTFSGLLLVDGNLTVTGNATHVISGQAALVARGDISILGNSQLVYDQARSAGGASALAIVSSGGNIIIGGNAEIDGIVYAPATASGAGTITLEGNADIQGAVIGSVVSAEGNVEISYDEGALLAVPPTTRDRARLIE